MVLTDKLRHARAHASTTPCDFDALADLGSQGVGGLLSWFCGFQLDFCACFRNIRIDQDRRVGSGSTVGQQIRLYGPRIGITDRGQSFWCNAHVNKQA